MAKFNNKINPEDAAEARAATVRSRATSPVTTSRVPDTQTFEGAPAYSRNAKSDLFILGVNNMVGEDTFYESGKSRDNRFRSLIHHNAISDPLWTFEFLRWLRSDANMRSAPTVGAAEFVRARLEMMTQPDSDQSAVRVSGDRRGVERAVIDAVCQRPDEPGELLAYWVSNYGKAIPKPIKRGLADAVNRLYTERNLLKYDGGENKGFKFGDVIELVHPTGNGSNSVQGALFTHAIDKRHGRETRPETLEKLAMIRANRAMREQLLQMTTADARTILADPDRLSNAGMTWENVLSAAGSRVNKDVLWESIIPSMGLMALVRNLRNFDLAGVSSASIDLVLSRMADANEVRRSRMFPFRYFSAFKASNSSMNWGRGLSQALDLSCSNIPELPGRTLILADTSGSMGAPLSRNSKVSMVDAAALFAVAVGRRNLGRVDLYGFADGVFHHSLARGGSVLDSINTFINKVGSVGYGTNTAQSLRATYQGHDRVVIFTDGQTFGHRSYSGSGVSESVPANIPIYAFNLAGYAPAMMPSGSDNRHEFGGGFSDATFRTLPLLEAGKNAAWPWLA